VQDDIVSVLRPYTLVDAFYSACNVLANTGDDQVMSKFQQFALGGAPGLITFTDPQVTR
jgi:hypothetical protein